MPNRWIGETERKAKFSYGQGDKMKPISDSVINVWGDVLRISEKKDKTWKVSIIPAKQYEGELMWKCLLKVLKDLKGIK